MSLFIKYYFTSSMLNMFQTLIHPSSEACDFSVVSPHWLRVLVSMCVGVSVWLGWSGILVATRIPPQPSHTETPTHIETRTRNQCGDTTEKSQAPDETIQAQNQCGDCVGERGSFVTCVGKVDFWQGRLLAR